MTLTITPAALCAVSGAHPAQVWAFVCDSRAKDAKVVAAYIAVDRAKAHARSLTNGCTRFGRVVEGKAETF